MPRRNSELAVTRVQLDLTGADARLCENCRAPMPAWSPNGTHLRGDAKVCSTRCRVAMYRKRKWQREAEARRNAPPRSCCWRGPCACVRAGSRNILEDETDILEDETDAGVTIVCPPIGWRA